MKNNARLRFLLAAAASLLSAMNANAQTNQTVEGAQRFLALQVGSSVDVVGAVRITIHRSHNDGTKDSVLFAAHPKVSGLGVAERSGVRDECTSTVTGLNFSTDELSLLRAGYVRYSEEALRQSQFIDWRKASIIRESGSISIVTPTPMGSGLVSVWFKTSDKDLLDRIEYASKFLQMSCDPTANTGF